MRGKTRAGGTARWAAGAVAAALTLATASACTSSSSGSAKPGATAASSSAAPTGTLSRFPRSQTLYTSGTAYAPPTNWNPFDLGNFATGTQGLVYEPLFLYDPVKNTYDPWLATDAAARLEGSTYVIDVRSPA